MELNINAFNPPNKKCNFCMLVIKALTVLYLFIPRIDVLKCFRIVCIKIVMINLHCWLGCHEETFLHISAKVFPELYMIDTEGLRAHVQWKGEKGKADMLQHSYLSYFPSPSVFWLLKPCNKPCMLRLT